MKKKIQKLETKNEDNLLNSGNKFKKIQKLETKMKIIDQIDFLSLESSICLRINCYGLQTPKNPIRDKNNSSSYKS
jgi:hypothetical protein